MVICIFGIIEWNITLPSQLIVLWLKTFQFRISPGKGSLNAYYFAISFWKWFYVNVNVFSVLRRVSQTHTLHSATSHVYRLFARSKNLILENLSYGCCFECLHVWSIFFFFSYCADKIFIPYFLKHWGGLERSMFQGNVIFWVFIVYLLHPFHLNQ